MINVEWPEWSELINPSFLPYADNRDRYLILYGGRGSSKSDRTAKDLIFKCINEPYFRFLLIRNNYNTIKDSQYQTIKDTIEDLGLSELFEFRVQPLEIECINGNKFIARGCDDTTKLKSVKDPTGAWYEEEIPNESDFITITTSIRTKKARFLHEVFTINPEVSGNYADHWFYKRFFKGRQEKSFRDVVELEIDGQKETAAVSVMHSTYKDNPHLPAGFIDFLEKLRETNPYYYSIYCLGEWGNRVVGDLFYKSFKYDKTVKNCVYRPDLPLWLSVDENVNPYLTATLWQIDGKKAMQIDEFTMRDPENTLTGLARAFENRYHFHQNGLLITGDATSKKQDVKIEKGHNLFTLLANELQPFRPQIRIPTVNPSVVARGFFINQILAHNQSGIEILIDPKCSESIKDLQNTQQGSDGAKLKTKIKSSTGVSFEPFGHCSDTMDYLLCQAFKNEFDMFMNGNKKPVTTIGRNDFNTKTKY